MGNLLTIDDLSIAYPTPGGKIFHALKNISIEVERGQIVGIVGESGAGKSTIGKTALGLLDENAEIEGGRLTLGETQLSGLSEAHFTSIRGKRIGYIYQNAMTALNPVLTIGEQLIETIQAHTDKKGNNARAYAIKLLEQAEVPEAEDRLSKYPHQLSGGLCQRIVFAIAICAQPDLIIADEPTTALDVTVQKAVLETLKKLAQRENIAIILITHDMGVVAEMCNYVYVLRYGRMVEHGPAEQVLAHPSKEYSRELMAAIPRIDRKLDRFAVPSGLGKSKARDRALEFLMEHKKTTKEGSVEPLITVRNLSKTFVTPATVIRAKKAFKAVRNASFDVFRGETLGIVGESGAGKSSVGRMILGLTQPNEGYQITFHGRNLADLNSKRKQGSLYKPMQCIFQDPYSSLNPRMSAGENITHAIKAHGIVSRSEARELAGDLMELVGLSPANARKMPHAFSGGERQRIGIARALSFRPDFIFCDEPTSALDVIVQAEVLNLMKDLQDALGLTLLFVSHDLAVIRQMCDRVMVMKSGEIVETGSCDTVLDNPQKAYTQGLLKAMPRFGFGTS